jgi:hypothetical protein
MMFTEEPTEIVGGAIIEWETDLGEDVRTIVRTELARRPELLPHGCTRLVVGRDLRERGGPITWYYEEVEGEPETSVLLVTSAWNDHPAIDRAQRFVVESLIAQLRRRDTLIGLNRTSHKIEIRLPSGATLGGAEAEEAVETVIAAEMIFQGVDIPAMKAGRISRSIAESTAREFAAEGRVRREAGGRDGE